MQNTLQMIGLTQNDQKFMNLLSNQVEQTLTGKKVFQMFNLMMVGQKFQSKNDLFESQFAKIWQSVNKEIRAKTQKISQILINFKQNKLVWLSNIFKDSMIIEDEEGREKLIKFFDERNIESTKLLYQALSNKYSIDEFHKNCDYIPHTLTICETEFGKVIGGYTPLIWEKTSTSEYVKDESGSSFIFSLSNNDKLVLDKSKTAIYRCSPHGPLFGDGNSDLGISAPGSDCWSLVGRSYTNENYKSNQESYGKFNGNPGNYYYFGIKKWEVWQIIFSE